MGLTAIFISLRGYSLIGKTAILHIVILGSSPNISIFFSCSRSQSAALKIKCIITRTTLSKWCAKNKAREAQPGRAELWRCLGCKFKSYLEHLDYKYTYKGNDGIGRHE